MHLLLQNNHSKLVSHYYFFLSQPKISCLVRVEAKLQQSIPNLDNELWDNTLSSQSATLISSKDKMIQLKYLRRICYSPHRLIPMGKTDITLCYRCNAEVGELIHMIWTFSFIKPFWLEITLFISEKLSSHNIYCPSRCLPGGIWESWVGNSPGHTNINTLYADQFKPLHTNNKLKIHL